MRFALSEASNIAAKSSVGSLTGQSDHTTVSVGSADRKGGLYMALRLRGLPRGAEDLVEHRNVLHGCRGVAPEGPDIGVNIFRLNVAQRVGGKVRHARRRLDGRHVGAAAQKRDE